MPEQPKNLQEKLDAANAAAGEYQQQIAQTQGAHTEDAPQNDPKTEVTIEGSLEEFEQKRLDREAEALERSREAAKDAEQDAKEPVQTAQRKADAKRESDKGSTVHKGRE